MQNKSLIKNLLNAVQTKFKSVTTNPYKKVNLNFFKLRYFKYQAAGILKRHRMFGSYFYFYSLPELLHGLNEIFLQEIYKQELADHPYIIDCGANIGLSVIYLKQLYPGAEIIAFEPDEKNFKLLAKNVSSFNYQNVTIRNEAVWIDDTTLNFSNQGSMSSKIENEKSLNTNEVKAVRLKNFLNRDVDFLKIDIEGAEFKVVSDLTDRLNFVKNLFVEYHGSFEQNHELTSLFDLFSKNGFHYYLKEAAPVYNSPFIRKKGEDMPWDIQLNIFCFRK